MKVINQCKFCGNKDENSFVQLGGTQKDNSVDIDNWCKECNTVYSTHFDATGFSQSNIEEIKKKYPSLAKDIKENESKKVGAPTQQPPKAKDK